MNLDILHRFFFKFENAIKIVLGQKFEPKLALAMSFLQSSKIYLETDWR